MISDPPVLPCCFIRMLSRSFRSCNEVLLFSLAISLPHKRYPHPQNSHSLWGQNSDPTHAPWSIPVFVPAFIASLIIGALKHSVERYCLVIASISIFRSLRSLPQSQPLLLDVSSGVAYVSNEHWSVKLHGRFDLLLREWGDCRFH